MGILSGEATLISVFTSLQEQILSLKSKPHFGRAVLSMEANRKVLKMFLLVCENGSVSIHLHFCSSCSYNVQVYMAGLWKYCVWIVPLVPYESGQFSE